MHKMNKQNTEKNANWIMDTLHNIINRVRHEIPSFI